MAKVITQWRPRVGSGTCWPLSGPNPWPNDYIYKRAWHTDIIGPWRHYSNESWPTVYEINQPPSSGLNQIIAEIRRRFYDLRESFTFPPAFIKKVEKDVPNTERAWLQWPGQELASIRGDIDRLRSSEGRSQFQWTRWPGHPTLLRVRGSWTQLTYLMLREMRDALETDYIIMRPLQRYMSSFDPLLITFPVCTRLGYKVWGYRVPKNPYTAGPGSWKHAGSTTSQEDCVRIAHDSRTDTHNACIGYDYNHRYRALSYFIFPGGLPSISRHEADVDYERNGAAPLNIYAYLPGKRPNGPKVPFAAGAPYPWSSSYSVSTTFSQHPRAIIHDRWANWRLPDPPGYWASQSNRQWSYYYHDSCDNSPYVVGQQGRAYLHSIVYAKSSGTMTGQGEPEGAKGWGPGAVPNWGSRSYVLLDGYKIQAYHIGSYTSYGWHAYSPPPHGTNGLILYNAHKSVNKTGMYQCLQLMNYRTGSGTPLKRTSTWSSYKQVAKTEYADVDWGSSAFGSSGLSVYCRLGREWSRAWFPSFPMNLHSSDVLSWWRQLNSISSNSPGPDLIIPFFNNTRDTTLGASPRSLWHMAENGTKGSAGFKSADVGTGTLTGFSGLPFPTLPATTDPPLTYWFYWAADEEIGASANPASPPAAVAPDWMQCTEIRLYV